MTSQRKNKIAPDISAQQVEQYLEQHPDFFTDRPRILTQLVIPHACGDAVSFIEHQVQLLRKQNQQLHRKLTDFVNVARENDQLNARIEQLTLAIIEESQLDQLISLLKEHLRREFSMDYVVLRLWDEQDRLHPSCDQLTADTPELPNSLTSIMQTHAPICGSLEAEQRKYLFEGSAAKVKSAAILPLRMHQGYGLLAFGSHRKDRFHAGMGKMFLQYLARLVSIRIDTTWQTPASNTAEPS